jgi:hypothetical protein
VTGRPYATGTTVSPDRTRAELDRLVARYGATGFAVGWDAGSAAVQFRAHDRLVRFTVDIPDAAEPQFAKTARGVVRTLTARREAAAAEERRRWRSLLLAIKAKFELVETGITSFEEEFAVHIVLPDGRRVGEHLIPAIATAYEQGTMPALLPGAAS